MSRKLLPTQVRAIRRALDNGDGLSILAHRYEVPAVVIWQIRERKAYKDIPLDVSPRLHASWLETVRARNERYVEKWPLFHRPLADIERDEIPAHSREAA